MEATMSMKTNSQAGMKLSMPIYLLLTTTNISHTVLLKPQISYPNGCN